MHLFVTLELKGIQCYLRKSLNNRNRVSSPEWPKICFLIKEYELGFFIQYWLVMWVCQISIRQLNTSDKQISTLFHSCLVLTFAQRTRVSLQQKILVRLCSVSVSDRHHTRQVGRFLFCKYQIHASVSTYNIFVVYSVQQS